MGQGVPYGQRLTDLAGTRGDEVGLVFVPATGEERTSTFADLERRANETAMLLTDHGVGAGDLVVLGLKNSPEHIAVTFAAWKLGAPVLPLRSDLPAWERDKILGLASPALVVGDWADGTPAALGATEVRATDGGARWTGSATDAPPVSRIIASSGSTGTPKLILAPSAGVYVEGEQHFVGAGAVQLAVSPLYHTNGFSSCFPPLLDGNKVVLLEHFDAAQVIDTIERHRITRAMVVPTMLQRIARLEGVTTRDLSSIEQVVCGGAVLHEWIARAWLELIAPERFLMVYGGSEGIGIVMCTGAEWLERPGTTGRGVDCEIVVLDGERRPLPVGEIGEVWMRRASAEDPFRYVGADTPEPILDGLRTFGDMGRVDADGYLYIVDRRTDMIVTGGVNVFPTEVETALSDHPDLADVVVVGLPDPEWGRRVHAIVVPRELADPPVVDDLRAWARSRLASPKVPKEFEIVDALPRNEVGKINRSRLIAERSSECLPS